jgi:transposase InsO family protein
VKKIRSDSESEFKNLQVEEYLEEEGIKHEFSAPYTPQQKGEHSLPCHKPTLPSSSPQEDLV